MSSQSELIMAGLAAQLAVAEITTVEVVNSDIDMTTRLLAELPLVQLKARIGSEAPRPYEVGGFAMWNLPIELKCYYLDELDSPTQKELLTKVLKDAVGSDITFGETCTSSYVRGVGYGGEFPLWEVILDLEVHYEKEIGDA